MTTYYQDILVRGKEASHDDNDHNGGNAQQEVHQSMMHFLKY
jgi:hypothetical protein